MKAIGEVRSGSILFRLDSIMKANTINPDQTGNGNGLIRGCSNIPLYRLPKKNKQKREQMTSGESFFVSGETSVPIVSSHGVWLSDTSTSMSSWRVPVFTSYNHDKLSYLSMW